MKNDKKQNTKDLILEYLKKYGKVRPADLLNAIPVSEQMLYRHLSTLQDDGVIEKVGKSPRTFYTLSSHDAKVSTEITLPNDLQKVISENFLHVTPAGKRLVGVRAFAHWCSKRGFDVHDMAKKYKDVIQKYAKIRHSGLLDATTKMRNTFQSMPGGLCVSKVFYVDFYSIEIFGKTRLGQMLLYAKQSQDRDAILQIADEIKPKVKKLVKELKIDAVAFVPPTVKRKVQFMNVLEKRLTLRLPKLKIAKVLGDVAVPQKTLKSMEDRVENAEATFEVDGSAHFSNVLVIDDAVGSGASLNQIACKLKMSEAAKKVYGMAITGSLNDFDVISEV